MYRGLLAIQSCTHARLLLRRMSNTVQNKVVESSIRRKLQASLNPCFLDVINESYMHNVPKGAETHFKVVVVSNDFNNKPLIVCHRMVQELLKDELETGVHALSIVAKTPVQWEKSNKTISPSPACRGGFGK